VEVVVQRLQVLSARFLSAALIAAAALLPKTVTAQCAGVTGLFNTGEDDQGFSLPIGLPEPHYAASGMSTFAGTTSWPGTWVTAPDGSQWIAPTSSQVSAPLGDYFYTLIINVQDPYGMQLSGQWATDNAGSLFLNGTFVTGITADTFQVLHSFTVTGLLAGDNELKFVVNNGPGCCLNPAGLLVSELKCTQILPDPWTDVGGALAGSNGAPQLSASGSLLLSIPNSLDLSNAAPNEVSGLFVAASSTPIPFKGGTLLPNPFFGPYIMLTSPSGTVDLGFATPPGLPVGTQIWVQWAIKDPGAVHGIALSNALLGVKP